MKPYLLLPLFWLTTFPAFASPFTIEPVKGNLTATWKGDAGAIVAGAPTDEDIAALASNTELHAIEISGCTALTGKGFAALKDLPKLRSISFNGAGPERFSALFGGNLEGYAALGQLKQVTVLRCGHVRLPTEGAVTLLVQMTSLETFNPGTYADDRILEAATKAPSLRQLGFGHWPTEPDPKLTMTGVGHYSKMMKLESLGPGQLRPADGSMADLITALSKTPSLKSMKLQMNAKMSLENRGHPKDLYAAKLSDLTPFAQFPALTTLILNGVIIPEGGLASFAKIASLKTLRFENSNIPESEVSALKKLRPELIVTVAK